MKFHGTKNHETILIKQFATKLVDILQRKVELYSLRVSGKLTELRKKIDKFKDSPKFP